MLESLIEFCVVLGIAAIIGAAVFFSMADSIYITAYGALLFWIPFFVVPMFYYGLIKVVIFKHL